MHGLYFEDSGWDDHYQPRPDGYRERYRSFAGLSGDYNLIHTDAEYAWGPRGAPPTGCWDWRSSGLAVRTGVLEGTVLAFREINGGSSCARYIGGDPPCSKSREQAPLRRRRRAVSIDFDVQTRERDGHEGNWKVLVASRPELSSIGT
jgi:hypothetical protein